MRRRLAVAALLLAHKLDGDTVKFQQAKLDPRARYRVIWSTRSNVIPSQEVTVIV
jgi:hypothetical protein